MESEIIAAYCRGGEQNMTANFTQTQTVNTAERNNTAPFVDVTTFGGVLSDLVTNKPGADSAEIGSEYYTLKLVIYDL